MYVRMFVMMLIGLYTSRVILTTLGVEDYGIYNVVGGVVAMFAIISSSLSSSISRFLTFEIGRGNTTRLKDIFSTSVIVQIALAVAIVVIMEIVGVWFLNHKMNIPASRLDAANFVMQCSIFSFAINLLNAPYNAAIIAHERFGIFAYLTLSDSILKLLVVFLLYVSPFDKLKSYAFLLLIVTILVQTIYIIYCRRQFDECRMSWHYTPALLREMGGFAGWSFFGNASWIINTQGIDILINLFFGVTLNAARGVANQVNNIVQSFVSNFMAALNPQITKSYAQNDLEYMRNLVCAGAKYSFFLMFFFSLPLCLETEQILVLWLKIVPEYAVPFVRLTLVATMLFVLGNTLSTAQSATGQMRKSAIYTSIFTFLEFPIVYALFKAGLSPITCYLVHAVIYFLLAFVKVWLVKKYILISYWTFTRDVILRSFAVVVVASPLPLFLRMQMSQSFIRIIVVCSLSILCTLVSICLLGMKGNERSMALAFVKSKLGRR